MVKANLLVVEDNIDLCQTLADVFRKVDYHVLTANSGAEAEAVLKAEMIDLVLLDLQLPDASGLDVLKKTKEIDPDILVIIITANTDVQPAVASMKQGAYDYLMKPFELAEVRMVVEKALETQSLKREVSRIRREQKIQNPSMEMYGESPALDEVKKYIKMVAETPRTPVLIEGESGTGKELVANAIHNWSARHNKPLVKINCAAIPENLLESELFGHERGAFTDAKSLKKGIFEMAHPGTIFLDEISSMSLALQPKLLRIIETQTFKRIGGMADIQLDVRIVAASNRNLETLVKQGEFREDLLYRLKVMVIDLPPLRDRQEDILPLAHIFLQRNNKEFGKNIRGIEDKAKTLLQNYGWPGNVRELKNVIERAIILCRDDWIEAELLPVELREKDEHGASGVSPKTGAHFEGESISLSEMEKRHIVFTLDRCGGNKSKTARELGISRSTLREKLKLYELQ